MTIDQAREYTVIVNGGSGCFFQPSDPEATYILTAKHNLEDTGNTVADLAHFHFRNDSWGSNDIKLELEEGINYYPHPELDIAILRLERIDSLDSIFTVDNLDVNRQGYFLLGYPNTRRNNNTNDKREWYREDPNVEILGTTTNQRRGAQIPGNPDREEVIGHSGGAIVRIENERLLLAGVENSMAQAVNEQMGRVEFTPIQVFNEIVELYTDRLYPLLPPHLLSFEFLRAKAFELNLDRFQKENLSMVLSFLRAKSKEIVGSGLTPANIRDRFNKGLLVDVNDVDNLSDKQVWQAWLELLTVLNIARKEKCSLVNLEKVFNRYRLKYLATDDDWTEHFESIQYADYKGLESKEGKVFIKTLGDSSETGRLDLPDKMVANIARDFEFELLKTDSGSHPFKDFKFYHIDYLKKSCIRDNEEHFRTLNEPEEILEALKNEYTQLFT